MPDVKLPTNLMAVHGHGFAHEITDDQGQPLAGMYVTDPYEPWAWPLTQAMAAAPRLLAAAKEAAAVLLELEGDLPELRYTINAVLEPLHAAIGKAEGKSK